MTKEYLEGRLLAGAENKTSEGGELQKNSTSAGNRIIVKWPSDHRKSRKKGVQEERKKKVN